MPSSIFDSRAARARILPAMSERDILHRWLARAAARLRTDRRLRDLGTLACALLTLLALHQVLRAALPVPPVIAAVTPLFVLAALGCLAVFAWRLTRRVTLAEAAAAADARADLKDELKSAYWLGEPDSRHALVALLVRRASIDVQRLDLSRLFPLRAPRSALAALGLALLTGGLAWLSPRVAVPASDGPAALSASAGGAHSLNAGSPAPAATHERPVPAEDRQRALWAAVDALAVRIAGSPQAEAIKRAVAARDAQRAAQLLTAARRRDAAAAAQGSAARPEGEQMSAELAQGILDRVQALLQEEEPAPAGAQAPAPSTARLAQQLREDMGDAERGRDERSSQGEMQLNAMLRAVTRTSIGERQVVQGGGEAGEENGRAQTGGGAMGRRVNRSRAGAGDGEQGQADPSGELEADPVLGARTQRLQAQLQKVRVERSADDDGDAGSDGREESFYDATQAQAAQLTLRDVVSRPTQAAEAVVTGQQTPLAYREAVKQYSLMQHRKER